MALPTVQVRIELSGIDTRDVFVAALRGTEEIAQTFELDVDVVTKDASELRAADLLGVEATVTFSVDGEDVRVVHGFVSFVEDGLATPGPLAGFLRGEEGARPGRCFSLRLVPRLHRMTLVETQEVYVDVTLPDILRSKLELAGFVEGTDFDLRLGAVYPARELVVQYRESDLTFVSRITQQAGISFFFEHGDGCDKVVFTDHNAAYASAVRPEPIAFDADGGFGISALVSRHRLVPALFAVQDYNYRTPLADVTGRHELEEGFGGGVVEYAPHAKNPDEAAAVAKIRAEEARAARDVYRGEGIEPKLGAGRTFVLEGHPLLPPTALLVTRIEHRFVAPAFAAAGASVADARSGYACSFSAIEAKTPFRPRRTVPKPRIYGFVTGNVEPVPDANAPGARDAMPSIDDQGRYWVRFHFDTTSGADRVKASRPIRMAQSHAGAGYGMHFPLRPGVEVLLAFLDGDPDRPIIIGAVPNAATPSPVAAATASLNRIVTSSGVTISIRDF